MSQKDFCQDCHLKHDCQEVYRHLGCSECPPVFFKTIVAFLLPIAIFTVSLAVFEKIVSGRDFLHFSQKLQTAIGFFIALLITVVFMLVFKLISKLLRKFLRIVIK